MADTERVLVIDTGEIYSRGFLFRPYDSSYKQIELLEHKQILHSLSEKELLEVLKLNFQGKYDRVEVVGDRKDWFRQAVGHFSVYGKTVGILLSGDHTYIEHANFGRIVDSRELKFGVGKNIERLIFTGGLDFLNQWLQIVDDKNDRGKILNRLGNYTLYPSSSIQDLLTQNAIISILRFIFGQITLAHTLYFRESSFSWSEHEIHRVIISGELVPFIHNIGELALAIIDGLQLEGVWEIFLDKNAIMTSLGFSNCESLTSHLNLGLIKLGTVVTFTHQYSWGESLGELNLDLGLSESQELPLRSGEMIRIPLGEESTGEIEFDVRQDVLVKGYQNSRDLTTLNHSKVDQTGLSGGELGLIIDVRGRPLPVIDDVALYQQYYPHWREALG